MRVLTLRPGRQSSLDRRHPWLFSGAVAHSAGDSSDGRVEGRDAAGAAGPIVALYRDVFAPRHLVVGDGDPQTSRFREYGLEFTANLGDGQKTGFFLDQRENRRQVRQLARGRRVLNLFSYSGAFS